MYENFNINKIMMAKKATDIYKLWATFFHLNHNYFLLVSVLLLAAFATNSITVNVEHMKI